MKTRGKRYIINLMESRLELSPYEKDYCPKCKNRLWFYGDMRFCLICDANYIEIVNKKEGQELEMFIDRLLDKHKGDIYKVREELRDLRYMPEYGKLATMLHKREMLMNRYTHFLAERVVKAGYIVKYV
jgi:hypothetical protein